MARALILDTHPVQYRVPIYKELHRLLDGSDHSIHVAYSSDSSIRGAQDVGFGQTIAWDEPMQDGYPNTFLPGASERTPAGFRSLGPDGLVHLFAEHRPDVVLLNGLLYHYYVAAMHLAKRHRAKVWLRSETQDAAFRRSAWKGLLRAFAYRAAYSQVDRFFAIGNLNSAHYRNHGIPSNKIDFARYCVVDRFDMPQEEKDAARLRLRHELGISREKFALLFSGKLIEKKNPSVILEALMLLPDAVRDRFVIIYMGSGPLDANLKASAEATGVSARFPGFVNQSRIADFYLASDALVLPSRQMGETWGLVANESLMAGRPVILSRHAGCTADFQGFEGVTVVDPEPAALAQAFRDVAGRTHDETTLRSQMRDYTVEAAAAAFANRLRELPFQAN